MAPHSRPRYESVDIPAPVIDLAQRRTEFLFHVMTYGDKPMKIVLASAYLQGMNDAVDALDAKDEREKAKPPEPVPFHC
jgi:hypothetical protein